MKYTYYPGCSLEGTAAEYDISTRAMMQALDVELMELEDWTCCGATSAATIGRMITYALPARNLAMAERMDQGCDLLIPCSACYLNLKKVEEITRTDRELFAKINEVLDADGIRYEGKVHVRHLLDVMAHDIGPAPIQTRRVKSFDGMSIAPYYGCQCLRPFTVFDDPDMPRTMEPLIAAAGASVHHWQMGSKCCGASLMSTKPDVAIELVTALLAEAKGADAVVTVCPMCQMNLEAYQKKASRRIGEDLGITILYLPQLLGLAMGLSEQAVRLDLNLSVTDTFLRKLRRL
jgi:heterodisulfide reductase subunit B2